jgi:hypothetical protein
MRNQDIRNLIRTSNIRNYMVAEQLGISDNTFYIKLRKKLTIGERERVLSAIEAVKIRQQHIFDEATV